MSPTSYQTAPPRTLILTHARTGVKSDHNSLTNGASALTGARNTDATSGFLYTSVVASKL